MDLMINIWLAILSIALLLETIILIGHYLKESILKTKLTTLFFLSCLSLVIAIFSGLLGGFIYKYFEHYVFNYAIILIVWIPIYFPIYYIFEKFSESQKDEKIIFNLDNYKKVNSENSIVIDYLIDKDRRLFSDIDALSSKISQIITLDGAIIALAFTGISLSNGNNLSILALTIIICSIIIGIMSLSPEKYYLRSASKILKNDSDGEAVKDIISGLLTNYPINLKKHNKKAQLSQYMFISMVVGLIILVLSIFI